MNSPNRILSKLQGVVEIDGRFKQEAYVLVMYALERVLRKLKKPRHITGKELLKIIQQEANQQYGPMAKTVLEHWGIHSSLDFGYIVFNMVECGILQKTETDTLQDFEDQAFFDNLFDELSAYRILIKQADKKQLN